ncbi:hypothetical protein AGMMS50230_04810 [Spirochaetia bacterium]|nr:hypothetical protein AGMMS50230_04810 [Spirochaetia bacterium]
MDERASRKAAIAQRLRDDGLDVTLCGEALNILEAALFGGVSALQYQQPVHQQAQTSYIPPSVPQYQQPEYVQQNQSVPHVAVKKRGLWIAVFVLNILWLSWVSRFITGHKGTGILLGHL